MNTSLEHVVLETAEIERNLRELNSVVLEGKALDAFEKFYHEDVAMQENERAPVVGKEANRKREMEFFGSLKGFKSEVKGLAVNGNLSFVIWHYSYTHTEWGVKDYTQVSVQQWKDGQIIREQFFYGN